MPEPQVASLINMDILSWTHFNTLEKRQGQYDDDCDIFWASGACFFIRSTVYWELKASTMIFAHQEEIDLLACIE
jgi:GT2 family glycosyltransferase